LFQYFSNFFEITFGGCANFYLFYKGDGAEPIQEHLELIGVVYGYTQRCHDFCFSILRKNTKLLTKIGVFAKIRQ
jgi:hypothetical protein